MSGIATNVQRKFEGINATHLMDGPEKNVLLRAKFAVEISGRYGSVV